MKTTVFKRMLSIVVALVMIFSCFAVSMVAYANSNIKIAGVDIGYADGDYYTKNGRACIKHKYSSGSNCMSECLIGDSGECEVNLRSSQSMGYARYCQWKVYGAHDYDSSKFDNLGSFSAAYCTEEKIKAFLGNCNPATHVRLENEHSIVIISVDDNGVKTTDCNSDWRCGIRTKDYTWKEFADYVKSKSGIEYAKSAKQAPTISQPDNPDEPDSNGGFFAAIINFFKILFSFFLNF